jgi:branched-chain amino acid aminotransferase
MSNTFYVDGQFVSADDAHIPITDLALLRGFGIFDYTRTFNGQPFHLEDHVERLFRSAQQIDLPMPWSLEDICAIVHETLARNDHSESGVRIVVTGGDAPDTVTPGGDSRLAVLVTPYTPYPASHYRDGVRLITVNDTRYMPMAKTLNYIPAVRAIRQARAQGALDALYVDPNGCVPEGTTLNIFAFYGDTLVTPEDGVLPGITRAVALKLADGLFPIERRPLPLAELYEADEVFITSSTKSIMPVARIDDRTMGPPGENTVTLMGRFSEYTATYKADSAYMF